MIGGTNRRIFRVRFDVVYAGWLIGNAIVKDAPYVSGDITYHGQKIGHMQTRDNAKGQVQYFAECFGLSVEAIRQCVMARNPSQWRLVALVEQEEGR